MVLAIIFVSKINKRDTYLEASQLTAIAEDKIQDGIRSEIRSGIDHGERFKWCGNCSELLSKWNGYGNCQTH